MTAKPTPLRFIDTHAGLGHLRPRRRRSDPHGRMARRHRPHRSRRRCRPAIAEILQPYLAAVGPRGPDGTLAAISGLARRGPMAAAAAGQADALRTSPGGCRGAATQSRQRPADQDPGRRRLRGPERRFAAAGAARPRAHRPPVREDPRVRHAAGGLARRPQALAHRELHGLVPAEGPRRGGAVRRGPRDGGHPARLAGASPGRRPGCRTARRLGPRLHQSALHAEGRGGGCCSPGSPARWPGRAQGTEWTLRWLAGE